MTLQDLNHHFDLLEQQQRAQEMLEQLRSNAYPRAVVLTGMPRAPGISDKVGNLAAEIADMSAAVEYAGAAVKASEERIQGFVEGIEDNHIRIMFRLRFLRGLAWKEVAAFMGGGNTDNGVRAACYRYLRRHL